MTTQELISVLTKICQVHPKARDATVHVVEGGRDEGLLHTVRYKERHHIVILEGDRTSGLADTRYEGRKCHVRT